MYLIPSNAPTPEIPRGRSKYDLASRRTDAALRRSGSTTHSAKMMTFHYALEAAARIGKPYRVDVWPGRGAIVTLLSDDSVPGDV